MKAQRTFEVYEVFNDIYLSKFDTWPWKSEGQGTSFSLHKLFCTKFDDDNQTIWVLSFAQDMWRTHGRQNKKWQNHLRIFFGREW